MYWQLHDAILVLMVPYQTVEMHIHRSGYRPNFEPIATHCRRRFRLTPAQNPDPSLPPPDLSLWIWHYSQTEPQNRFPAHQIRISDAMRQSLHERSILQKHGQLERKEFMLRDSANWPVINLPGTGNMYPAAQGYPGDVISHMNRSQQQAYIQQQHQQQQQQQQRQHQQQANVTQQGIAPPPAKRQRHGGPGHAHGSITAIPAPVVVQDNPYDEEEGTSGGDYMDFLTPREISLRRYTQHHEWLEEILNSPYDTSQIIPGQLGLGRKGELESLTRDFFDAPIEATPRETFPKPNGEIPEEESATPRVGRLESGKAEDFTKRATEKIAEINSEMEKLKRQHARRMAKLNKGRTFKEAEQNLRASTIELINGEVTKGDAVQQQHKADELATRLEAYLGKSIKSVKEIECIDKGGLEEKDQAKDAKDHDYDMADTFAHLDGATTSSNTYPEPKSPGLATPMQPAENTSTVTHDVPVAENSNQEDVKVDDVQKITESKDSAAEDWVMVDKENNLSVEGEETPRIEGFVDSASMPTSTNPNDVTTGDNVPLFEQGTEPDAAEDFDANDFAEDIDFGDLDTAGEDLSGYPPGIENAGFEEQGEGAFRESFQVMEESVAHEDTSPGV